MKTYFEISKIEFEDCAECKVLPGEIKCLIDIYNEAEIVGKDQETEYFKIL